MENKKIKSINGFTIIELIVVIAIIAVLAGIILTNVTQYIGKSKLARANADVQNIQKALNIFYTQYSDYPYSGSLGTMCPVIGCDVEFAGSNNTYLIPSDPFLTDATGNHYLSEFYNPDYNADFFVQGGYYDVTLFDNDNDGKIGCGIVSINNTDESTYNGSKCIICQDCTCSNDPDDLSVDCADIPFSLSPL